MARTSKIYGVFLAALILLSAGSASAYVPLRPGFNTFEFVNWENLIDADGSRTISVGDRFYGIANVQQIKDQTGVAYWFESATDHVSAYFYNEVAAVNAIPGSNLVQILFKAATVSDPNGVISDTELAAGATLKFYGSTTGLTFTNLVNSIASATDGDELATMSMTGGYWWSNALLVPFGLTPGTDVADSLFGLNVLSTNGYFGNLQYINDPSEDLYDLNVQLYAESTVQTNERNDASRNIWAFTSDDPAVVATPEPASMLLLGSGLMGLFAARRRKAAQN